MAITLQTGIKQSQKLIMTQSLKQAIELLQMSTIELYEKISNELIENPVLDDEGPVLPSSVPDESGVLSGINQNLSGDESILNRGDEHQINFGHTSDSGFTNEIDEDKKRNYLENVVAHRESLAEHLLWQARMSAKNEHDLNIYENIITSLDENGFITVNPAELTDVLKTEPAKIEEIIRTIQNFDPVGCATRSIQESLSVQCRCFYPGDKILLSILEDHFIDFEKLNYDKISRALNIPMPEVLEKGKAIQSLDPFPGRQYSRKEIRYIIPDIEVRMVDNEIIVSLNDDWVPRININSYYIDVLKKKSIEKKLREYIQDKLQSARYLIKNIDSRRNTIIRVVSSIMEHQRDFMKKGPGHLRPLTHLDIADEIEMHESTVSRVTSNKFVQTSWGVFELKYFFVSRLKSGNNEKDTSSDQVMSLIKGIIEQECGTSPLSDEDIVNILKKSGITVARRTIAKYRGIMSIPSSSIRKKINMIKTEEKP